MKFQSKYTNHTLIFKPTRRVFHPDSQSWDLVPGVRIEFTGNQRLFDSEAQGWEPELVDQVENFVLKHPEYGQGIYLGPGQALWEEKYDIARVKPPRVARKCQDISFNEMGEVIQCQTEPTAGKKFCAEHDPDAVKIKRGMTTTA